MEDSDQNPLSLGMTVPPVKIVDNQTGFQTVVIKPGDLRVIDLIDEYSIGILRKNEEFLRQQNNYTAIKFVTVYYGNELPEVENQNNLQLVWGGEEFERSFLTQVLRVQSLPYSVYLEDADIRWFGDRRQYDLDDILSKRTEVFGYQSPDNVRNILSSIQNKIEQFNIDYWENLRLDWTSEVEVSQESKLIYCNISISGQYAQDNTEAFQKLKQQIDQEYKGIRFYAYPQQMLDNKGEQVQLSKDASSLFVTQTPQQSSIKTQKSLTNQERIIEELQQKLRQQEKLANHFRRQIQDLQEKNSEIPKLKDKIIEQQDKIKKISQLAKDRSLNRKQKSFYDQIENRNKELLKNNFSMESQIMQQKKEIIALTSQLNRLRSDLEMTDSIVSKRDRQVETAIKKVQQLELVIAQLRLSLRKSEEHNILLKGQLQEMKAFMDQKNFTRFKRELQWAKKQIKAQQAKSDQLMGYGYQSQRPNQLRGGSSKVKLPSLSGSRAKDKLTGFETSYDYEADSKFDEDLFTKSIQNQEEDSVEVIKESLDEVNLRENDAVAQLD